MRNFHIVFFFIFSTFSLSAQSIATFESFNLPLDTFLNGSDGQTVYQDSDINFPTNFSGGFWIGGWAISTKRDDTTSTFENLYSAKIASGFESSTYAVGQQNAVIRLNGDNLGKVVDGLYLTNSTFAHDVIRDGNTFSKKFGGETGNDPDFFRLDIQKYYQGELSTEVVEFYLADYRFEDNSEDFIVDDWQWVDLSNLGNVDSLLFTLSSTDVGNYGINTPLFFCLDDLTVSSLNIDIPTNENISTFEENNLSTNTFLNGSNGETGYQSGNAFYPTSFSGGFWIGGWAISTVRDDTTATFENLYGAKTAAGVNSLSYAVGQQNAVIQLEEDVAGSIVNGLYITNTTFAHSVIRDGNMFSKKFGGETGNDPDFFRLDIQKYSNGELAPQVVEFYLADYRFEDNNEDFIVDDWQWVDLTSLGNVDSLFFTLTSTDVGNYGINTPLFFSIDNLEISEAVSTSNENILLTSDQLSIYPNPAINEITLDLGTIESAVDLTIFDGLGRQVLHQAINPLQSNIDISNLEKGTYFLQVRTTKEKQFTSIFMKN